MIITKIWFRDDYLYGEDENGKTYRQSLLWYKKLRKATAEERAEYTFGYTGIHWRKLDEDVSFESFTYEDAEPTKLQRFFLTHPEINIPEFARMIPINPTLLSNYINGFKKPSKEREQMILRQVHRIGEEYMSFAL